MRAWVWLLILLAALWGGWWAFATTQMQTGVRDALQARQAAGWQVTGDAPRKAGFPLALETRLDRLTLAAPARDDRLDARGLRISAPVWWPVDLSITAKEVSGETRAGALPLDFTFQTPAAALSLHPAPALTVKAASAASAALRIEGPDGLLLDLAEPRLQARQQDARGTGYAVSFDAGQITPGPLLIRLLTPQAAPPEAPEARGRGVLTFDRALDRNALQAAEPPRLTGLQIESFRMAWGALALTARGALEIDSAGLPEGRVTLKLTQWRRLIEAAQRAGLLPPAMRLQVETMLGALENRGGTPGELDLELGFAEGQMSLAGIPLGPAPRLFGG